MIKLAKKVDFESSISEFVFEDADIRLERLSVIAFLEKILKNLHDLEADEAPFDAENMIKEELSLLRKEVKE